MTRPRRVRRRGQPSRWDLVVKVGGSLGRGRDLPGILEHLAGIARRARVLLVPGGGRFADVVRSERWRLGLAEASAHRIALRAMDQYGLLIGDLCGAARPVGDLETARRVARRGLLPVLLASSMIERARSLERSFRLTSDSIAAYLAGRERAPRLVLLKSCAGSAGPIAGLAELRALARRGVIDPLFPALAPRACDIFVVNGRGLVAWDLILRPRRKVRRHGAPLGRRRDVPGRAGRSGRPRRARRAPR